MASQKLVILIAEGEAAEIVKNANTGIVVKPGDIEGLVKAIEYLGNNPDGRAGMGRNGRKLIEISYNRQVIIDECANHISNRK